MFSIQKRAHSLFLDVVKILIRYQSPFFENILYFDIAGSTIEVLFLKQPLILPFLCHKSATTCKIGSNKVSNSKLKSDLCNCVKIEISSPYSSRANRAQTFWDTL